MGQTDNGYKVIDVDGTVWTWTYICPGCDTVLATQQIVESMNLEGDDIIGCDECGEDISIDAAWLILIDGEGNRG